MGTRRKQRERRVKRRIPCAVTVEGKRYGGLALDLSSGGLYVQTNAKSAARAPAKLELSVPGAEEPILIEGVVQRRNQVPPQLVAAAKGGFGLRITRAPEAYYRLLRDLRDPARSGEERDAAEEQFDRPFRECSREPGGRRFRVRMAQTSGSRSRGLLVVCEDEQEARAQALTEMGEGWKVLEVETL